MSIEIRKIGETDFLSPERDLLNWFHPACRAAFSRTIESIADNESDMERKGTPILESMRRYFDGTLTSPDSAIQLVGKLRDELAASPEGKLMLMNLGLSLLVMYCDAVRRSAKKPRVSADELARGINGILQTACLNEEDRRRIEKELKLPEGFCEFDPGLYEIESTESANEK